MPTWAERTYNKQMCDRCFILRWMLTSSRRFGTPVEKVAIAVVVLCCAGLFVLAAFLLRFRESQVVRAISLPFSLLTISGCMVRSHFSRENRI